jgi:hypothetical protein
MQKVRISERVTDLGVMLERLHLGFNPFDDCQGRLTR